MKKETIILILLMYTLHGMAQDTAMCIYDASGNRLSRFVYYNRGHNSQERSERNGQVDMGNEQFGNHTIHVTYHSTTYTLTIEILGLDESDKCSAYIYSLTGQTVYRQDITFSPAEIDLSNNSNGVYLLRLSLNGENRCWKIIKK